MTTLGGVASKVVEGGAERHLSVWNGIKAVDEGAAYVAVHDGARPLVTSRAIERCLEVAERTGAATLGHPVTDTVKRCDRAGVVIEAVSRDGLWAMETPQIFENSLLRRAYEQVLASGETVTDEVSAIQRSGTPVTVVANDEPNLKITYPRDLSLAELLLDSPAPSDDGVRGRVRQQPET